MSVKKKILISLIIFTSTFALVFFTLKPIGINWDEPVYLDSSKNIIKWSRYFTNNVLHLNFKKAFSKTEIKKTFFPNFEHPPFLKLLFGISIKLFSPKILNELTAVRIVTIFFYSSFACLLFWFLEIYFNFFIAIFSVLFFILQPRLFGDAHFASFDLPFAFIYFASLITFFLWQKQKNNFYLILFFIFFVIGNLSRITMMTTILPFSIWLLIYNKNNLSKFAIIILGATFFYFLLMPTFWHNTFDNIYNYYYLNLTRSNWDRVPLYFLSKSYVSLYPYNKPLNYPAVYPYFMFLATTPIPTLFLFFAGLFSFFNKKNLDFKILLLIFLIFPLLLITPPKIPKYDGIRLFLSTLTILPVFSALGLATIFDFIKKLVSKQLNKILQVLIICAVIILNSNEMISLHPYYLSYFNSYIGGINGAQKKGLELTYWGEVVNYKVLNYLNNKISQKNKVIISPYPTSSLNYYRKNGMLNKSINVSAETLFTAKNFKDNDYLVLINRQGCFTKQAWLIYNNFKPIYILGKNNVMLLGIYNLKEIKKFLQKKG